MTYFQQAVLYSSFTIALLLLVLRWLDDKLESEEQISVATLLRVIVFILGLTVSTGAALTFYMKWLVQVWS